MPLIDHSCIPPTADPPSRLIRGKRIVARPNKPVPEVENEVQ
jgi:hypothetical protein